MSTNTLIRTGAIATLGVSVLSISAFTNAQTSSRYGGNDIGAYEGGHCQPQPSCLPAVPQQLPIQQAPVFAQPAPSVVYTQPSPAPVFTQQAPVYAQPSQILPGSCPTGTTAQPDGTCLQASYSTAPTVRTPTYRAGPAFTTPSYSTSSNSYSVQAPVDCPAGTTAQSDGTCLQSGAPGYSSQSSTYSAPSTSYGSGTTDYSSSSSSSYGSGTTTYSGETAACPAGSTAQSDGTCLQTGDLGVSSSSSYGSGNSYQGASVDLYTGDATASTTTQSSGYATENTYSSSSDYLPVRK